MTTLPKCCIESYVSRDVSYGVSIKQKNGICTNQKKVQNLRSVRSCGISLYRLTKLLNIIDQIQLLLTRKIGNAYWQIPHAHLILALKRKKKKKCTNYSELKYDIATILKKVRKVKVIAVVIGTLGTVTKLFKKWIEKLDLDLTIEALQKPCLLGTARIIQKVLDMR